MNYKGLVEKKNDLITRAEAILADAETNKRELTDDEAQELAVAKVCTGTLIFLRGAKRLSRASVKAIGEVV